MIAAPPKKASRCAAAYKEWRSGAPKSACYAFPFLRYASAQRRTDGALRRTEGEVNTYSNTL